MSNPRNKRDCKQCGDELRSRNKFKPKHFCNVSCRYKFDSIRISKITERCCYRCKIVKPFNEFNKDKSKRNGRAFICTLCSRAVNNQIHKKYPEKNRAKARSWNKKNKPIMRERKRRYEAQKLKATPAWANIKAMIAIYEEAEKLSFSTGIKYHVDHIVPLQSAIVCGLHCEQNLRPIPAVENIAKKNRYWENMPKELHKETV